MKKAQARKDSRIFTNNIGRDEQGRMFAFALLAKNIVKYRSAFDFILKNKDKISPENFDVFETHYINSLIACSETYLHDFLAFAMKDNSELKLKVEMFVLKEDTLDIDVDEVLTKLSFQDLETLKKLFKFLTGHQMIERLKDVRFCTGLKEVTLETNMRTLFLGDLEWWNIIKQTYMKRHATTHIAHDLPKTDKLAVFEKIIFYFLQLYTNYISINYNLELYFFSKNNKYIYLASKAVDDDVMFLISVDNLFAGGWQIIEA